jgi:uncharacterized protein YndB with AHSA1/START domain
MTTSTTTRTTADGTTTIEAPADLPVIRMTRDFQATPAQLVRAHTDADVFVRWTGPEGTELEIDHWDARTGGSWRYHGTVSGGEEHAFRGCFHTVREDRLVQTFTWEGMPDSVALETMTFEDLGDGRTRLHAESLMDSFEARDGMLSSGMDVGVNDGYAKLDALLEAGDL